MMRKQFAVVALATIVTCGLVLSASAQTLFEDGFNYPTGGLSGNGGWTGGDAANLFIVSGQLTYPGLQSLPGNELEVLNGTSGSAINTYASQSSTQVFLSFLFDPIVLDGGNDYFIALNPSGNPNGGSDAMDCYSYESGKIEIRANPQSAAGTVTPALNTTNLIVEEIDFVAKTASLWVNPGSTTFGSDSSEPAALTTLTGISATSVADVGFKSQSVSGEYLVDNLIIGNDWASVTPPVIPEPSTYLLVGSGLALVIGMIRRRRS